MVEFFFTQEQRARAINEGLRRQRDNELNRRSGRNNAPIIGASAERMHVIGAAGELAAAYYLGLERWLYQDKSPVRGSCDLPGIDVKTRTRHNYDLLVQIDDDPAKRFVLVTIENRKTMIHGWIDGASAMNKSWIKAYKAGRSCYAVPQNHLRPIEELRWQVAAAQKETIFG